MDCKNIFGRLVEFILRQDQLTQVRAHPEGMERDVAREDCPPVNLKADCLPNRANAELSHQPDDVQPVADNDKLDVSCLLLSSQFWPMLSMSRGVIKCAKLFFSHRLSRIKSFDQWAVDRVPFLTSTTSAKIGKTAIVAIMANTTLQREFESVRANSATSILSSNKAI